MAERARPQERRITEPTLIGSPTMLRFGSHRLLVTPVRQFPNEPLPSALLFFNARGGRGRIPMNTPPILIGNVSARENDLTSASKSVSPHHAQMDWTAEGWQLMDLGSLNGTFMEPIASCDTGTTSVPKNEWRLVPYNKATTISFAGTETTLAERGGVQIVETLNGDVREFVLPSHRPMLVGQTQKNNDIPLVDAQVGEQHATLIATDTGLLVHDNGAKGGTKVTVADQEELPVDERNLAYMRKRMGMLVGEESIRLGNSVTLNFYVHRQTGEIVMFTTAGFEPTLQQNPDLVVCRFHIAANLREPVQDRILRVEGTDLYPQALATLTQSADFWNHTI